MLQTLPPPDQRSKSRKHWCRAAPEVEAQSVRAGPARPAVPDVGTRGGYHFKLQARNLFEAPCVILMDEQLAFGGTRSTLEMKVSPSPPAPPGAEQLGLGAFGLPRALTAHWAPWASAALARLRNWVGTAHPAGSQQLTCPGRPGGPSRGFPGARLFGSSEAASMRMESCAQP